MSETNLILSNDLAADVIAAYGKHLLKNHHTERCGSFEEAAQSLTEDIYHQFVQPDGESMFALVRVFGVLPYEALPTDLQPAEQSVNQWITLMGTYGDEPAWQSRYNSRHHAVLPVIEGSNAMVIEAMRQLQLHKQDAVQAVPAGANNSTLLREGTLVQTFFVPKANDNNFITDQSEFVEPYGIQSVVALGSKFLSGAAYMLMLFSKTPIDAAQRDRLANLGPYVSTVLAIYDGSAPRWIT